MVAALPLASPMVKRRSVLWAPFSTVLPRLLNWRVPPPKTRLEAALLEEPMLLLVPPLAITPALRMPASICVGPE